MSEQGKAGLDPRELARIKMEARSRRIELIRKRVAVLGISLAALFSGTILARSLVGQTAVGQGNQVQGVALVSKEHDEESDDPGIGSVVVDGLTGLITGGQSGGSSSSAPAPSTQSAPLTTSQS